MTGEAPAGAPRLVARRRALDFGARSPWWEPWIWTVEGDDGYRAWLSYYGRETTPEPSPGTVRALALAGLRIDPDAARTYSVRQAVRYDVTELCEEHAWPLVRLAPSVEDSAPAHIFARSRREP